MIRALLPISLGVVWFIVTASAASAQQAATSDINLMSFANGALVERSSSVYGDSWDPFLLIMENPSRGWANAEGAQPPFETVISVPNRSEFRRFLFDTASAESPERAAKTVDIQISDDGKLFRPVMTVDLAAGADNQDFTPPHAVQGQYVKLVVRSNHGDDKYWELFNTRALGVPLEDRPVPNVTGTYEGTAYGEFHLLQEGAQLTGCYEYKGGLVQGGLESHAMHLTWREDEDKHGPAIMVLTRDGKMFRGAWRLEDDSDWSRNWNLTKISGDVGSCPHWKPRTAGSNLVAKDLAAQGRTRLYGINFDIDSDHIRPDAKPALDQLTAALKENAAWKVTIEGYTDATGSEEHNRDLSSRRAASVKAALAAAGLAVDRLSSAGFGSARPIASNDNDMGRAQNRRVEVAR